MDTAMADQENRTHSDKFMLRLPDGMRERIKAAAEANARSMNAEIVATLQEKYDVNASLRALVDAAHKRLRSLHPPNGTWDPELKKAVERLEREFEDPDLKQASSAAFAFLHGLDENVATTADDMQKIRQKFAQYVSVRVDRES